jgi:peptide/nickel transport system substrate-binding protein
MTSTLKLTLISGMALFFVLGIISCADNPPDAEVDQISIRVQEEPDRLHPLLSKTGISQQIESKIFLPLLAPHPETFALEPILLKKVPDVQVLDSNRMRIDFELRNDARWPNGSSITVEDIDFTIKAIFAPGMEQSNLRSYFDVVDSVSYSDTDSLSFSFHFSQSYILALPATGGLTVFPSYHYDEEDLLKPYSLQELKELDSVPPPLQPWVERMTSAAFSREQVRGSGPYQLQKWETGRYIQLERIPSWWGADQPDKHILMEARPKRLVYEIIPDESTALQLLKSGQLDILSDISPLQVRELRQDEETLRNYEIHYTQVLNQYVVLLNTNDPVLEDRAVRRALAHLIDVDQFVDEVLQGHGVPASSPIHPAKPFFDSTLAATPFDLEKAEQILIDHGWLDLSGEGIREKRIADGERVSLDINLQITGSALSQSIALKLVENARKVGMNIEITTQPFRNILESMRAGTFQMTPLSIRSSPFPYDPYQSWHTDNIGGGGGNYTQFGNDSSDMIIEKIRNTAIPEEAMPYYRKFQRMVMEDQPILLLAAPLQPILVKRTWDLPLTAMKPGYFENAIETSKYESPRAQ